MVELDGAQPTCKKQKLKSHCLPLAQLYTALCFAPPFGLDQPEVYVALGFVVGRRCVVAGAIFRGLDDDAGVQDDGRVFSLQDVTTYVHDPYFWCYGTMLLKMQSVLDGLAAWAESCQCHS